MLNRYGSSFLALMICLIVISPPSEASDLQCISLVQIRWPQLPEYLQTDTGRLFCPNWERNQRSVWRLYNREKTGDQTGFHASSWIAWEFHLSFLFAFSAPSLLLKLFIMSSFVKIKSCKSSELIPCCIKQYQFSLATVKLRMKQGIHGQTRTQRQGDFKDNSIISLKKRMHLMPTYRHSIPPTQKE